MTPDNPDEDKMAVKGETYEENINSKLQMILSFCLKNNDTERLKKLIEVLQKRVEMEETFKEICLSLKINATI